MTTYIHRRRSATSIAVFVVSAITCATKRKASGIVTAAGGAIRRTRYRWVKDTVLDNCRTVLYLHGFASSPNSQKIQSLRGLLAPLGVELELTGPWPAYNFVPGTIGAAW